MQGGVQGAECWVLGAGCRVQGAGSSVERECPQAARLYEQHRVVAAPALAALGNLADVQRRRVAALQARKRELKELEELEEQQEELQGKQEELEEQEPLEEQPSTAASLGSPPSQKDLPHDSVQKEGRQNPQRQSRPPLNGRGLEVHLGDKVTSAILAAASIWKYRRHSFVIAMASNVVVDFIRVQRHPSARRRRGFDTEEIVDTGEDLSLTDARRRAPCRRGRRRAPRPVHIGR